MNDIMRQRLCDLVVEWREQGDAPVKPSNLFMQGVQESWHATLRKCAREVEIILFTKTRP